MKEEIVEHQEAIVNQLEEEAWIKNEPKMNLQDEPEEQQEEERRTQTTLVKYVRRNHKPKKIIGSKYSGVMKMNRLRNQT